MNGLPGIVVAAAIIEQNDCFLLTKRLDGVHYGGFWEFPGGKQEPGESLEECLKREVREELEIEIGIFRPFTVVKYQYPEKPVELHFFCCCVLNGTPKPVGCAEWAWVPKGRLNTYPFPPADAVILEKILSPSS